MALLSQEEIKGSFKTKETSTLGLVQSETVLKLESATQYFWEEGQSHFFYRSQFGSIHCRTFLREKNQYLLVISPGRGESSLKYAEMVYDLKDRGFDILVLDHRGQGFSERYPQSMEFGHVENSLDYKEDLKFIVQHFKEKKLYKKSFLLGHSMGAAIGTEALLENKDLFQGMILCSPMLKLNTRGIPQFAARGILFCADKLNWAHLPIIKNLSDLRSNFEKNLKTGCFERFHFHYDQEDRHPQIRVGVPTLGWIRESISLTKRINKRKTSLKAPILLMQAENDGLVCSKAQDQFAHAVENCRIIRVKESRHEILSEIDDIRNRALVQIEKFLKEFS